jgi:hypothetical protein
VREPVRSYSIRNASLTVVVGRQHGKERKAKGLNNPAEKTGEREDRMCFAGCQKDIGSLRQMSWGFMFKKELVDEGKLVWPSRKPEAL